MASAKKILYNPINGIKRVVTEVRKFPDCYPKNFESEILPEGAREQEIEVYRVAKTGKIEESTFWSTFLENLSRVDYDTSRYIPKDPNDPSEYSTSFYEKYKSVAYVCKMLTKNSPSPIIIKGKTELGYGPSQRTRERKKEKKKHVDWWLYDKAFPQSFVVVERQEESDLQ